MKLLKCWSCSCPFLHLLGFLLMQYPEQQHSSPYLLSDLKWGRQVEDVKFQTRCLWTWPALLWYIEWQGWTPARIITKVVCCFNWNLMIYSGFPDFVDILIDFLNFFSKTNLICLSSSSNIWEKVQRAITGARAVSCCIFQHSMHHLLVSSGIFFLNRKSAILNLVLLLLDCFCYPT